jgi:hypothetical protein
LQSTLMSDPNARFQTVNAEQIMAQIRARIREKRGADRVDAQIRELAAARLAGLIGSHDAHAELLDQLRRGAAAAPEVAPIDDSSMYGPPGPLRWVRRLLGPILALFLSPKAVMHALGQQRDTAVRQEQSSAALFALIENLVLDTTRLEVEVKKLEMRVESQATRLEFAERRAREVEGMVRYRSEPAREPEAPQRRPAREAGPERPAREPVAQATAAAPAQPQGARDADPAGSAEARRRRRRRRGRRGGASRTPEESVAGGGESAPGGDVQAEPGEPAPGAEPGGGPAPEPRHEELRHEDPRRDEPPTPPDRDDQ